MLQDVIADDDVKRGIRVRDVPVPAHFELDAVDIPKCDVIARKLDHVLVRLHAAHAPRVAQPPVFGRAAAIAAAEIQYVATFERLPGREPRYPTEEAL